MSVCRAAIEMVVVRAARRTAPTLFLVSVWGGEPGGLVRIREEHTGHSRVQAE